MYSAETLIKKIDVLYKEIYENMGSINSNALKARGKATMWHLSLLKQEVESFKEIGNSPMNSVDLEIPEQVEIGIPFAEIIDEIQVKPHPHFPQY